MKEEEKNAKQIYILEMKKKSRHTTGLSESMINQATLIIILIYRTVLCVCRYFHILKKHMKIVR